MGVSKAESRWAVAWTLIIVGLTCLPYVAAWRLAPAGTQFTGLLVNPYDGESYYAKMQQGARGDWLFHLAFTPEPHEGAFVYTFYLALGHLAGSLHLPIPVIYHAARAAAGVFLLLVGYRFIARLIRAERTRRLAFLFLGLSAGLGWLMAPFGHTTADLWVAEGFTFLSILVNPHFPLAIGLMLLILMAVLDEMGSDPAVPPTMGANMPRRSGFPATTGGRAAGCVLLGLLLAVVQLFAVPVMAVVLAVLLAARSGQERRLPLRAGVVAAAAGLGALPVLAYTLSVFARNPAMAAWSAQNATPSLPIWDYALGYGLILILAAGGVPAAVRGRRPADLLALAWVASAAVLLYLPFALQRRFIIGLHVPLALLAAMGVEQSVWPRVPARRRSLVALLLVVLAALTNVLTPAIAVAGVAQGRAPLVMSAGQAGAWGWLKTNTAWTDTVLAPIESGQFVPAWAGNRVVYGHPFETMDAATKRAEVERFYSAGTTSAERRALLERYGVRYVFVGAPEQPVLTPAESSGLGLVEVWSEAGAALYRVEGRP